MIDSSAGQNELVYKYRNFSNNHLQAIRDNLLWFSVSDTFNDPFDSCERLFAENTKVASIIGFLEQTIPEFELDALKASLDGSGETLASQIFAKRQTILATEEIQTGFSLIFAQMMRSYIFCTSIKPTNPLMWAHYGDFHKGICVGYRKDLIDKLEVRKSSPVEYSKEQPDIMKILTIEADKQFTEVDNLICTKSNVWKYEEEYRFILDKLRVGVFKEGKDFTSDSIPIPHSENAIESIHFGLKASESDKKHLKTSLKNRNIKFFDIKQDGFGLISVVHSSS